jgi:hypothetical protein
MRRAPFTLLAPLVACAGSLASACGGSVATVPDGARASDAGAGPSQVPDASPGETKACLALGGVCLPPGATAPPDRRPARATTPLCVGSDVCWVKVTMDTRVCKVDAECNESPAISSLQGSCFEGACMCHAPFHVQPNGRCGAATPPECDAQGGKCRQAPDANCLAGELQGDVGTNMSCGDFAPAGCCFPAAACKAPVDFVCCGASTTPYEPTCVNGWRTCAGGGPTPRLRSQGCF